MPQTPESQPLALASPPTSRHPSVLEEFRDAVSLRTVGLIVGVLALQVAFIASYVGAFHRQTPRHIPVQVIAPQQYSAVLVTRLNDLPGAPLKASAATSEAQARRAIAKGTTYGVLILDPTSDTDQLLVASAAGTSIATAVESIITEAQTLQERTVSITDVVPLQAGDSHGLTGFYVVVGWLVGGYLMAAILGVARGARPATFRRACFRLMATVPYALLSGLSTALVIGPALGALTGHFWDVWWLGTLVVLAAAATTMAFETLFGVIGIGLTVLVFVVLGNPSAGGPYQGPLLPAFWRTIGPLLPNGAGTSAMREIFYFNSQSLWSRIVVILAWAAGGVLLTLVGARLRPRFHTS